MLNDIDELLNIKKESKSSYDKGWNAAVDYIIINYLKSNNDDGGCGCILAVIIIGLLIYIGAT